MAIQLQWSLDNTTSAALSVARGIFRAATHDNVQPLAILACERFGNTIAMCQETCRKIEGLVNKTAEPVAISFLRASAGFTTEDSATQLSKSQAGVQFLGLAAALVTSLGEFEGGNALEAMLNSSASDKTLLPTARQLKDLLASLEPRFQRSGFTDTVAGWEIFFCQSPAMSQQHRDFWKTSTYYPKPKGLDGLVDAFRRISRIGDSGITSVNIKVTHCAPWVVAFTKWCLGAPPSIYLDDGTVVLEQSYVNVTVLASIDSANCAGLEVLVYGELGGPSDLVAAPLGNRPWTGMVSIEIYGQWILQDHGFAAGPAHEALIQALPFAIQQTVESLRFSKYRTFDSSIPLHDWPNASLQNGPKLDEECVELRLSPFGKENAIAKMTSRILGLSEPIILRSLGGLRIADLPVVKLHLKTTKEHCLCSKCCHPGFKFKPCATDMFFHKLAFVLADILALSLFEYPNAPLVHLQHHRDGSNPFKQAIYSIISTGELAYCNLLYLQQYALELVGHNVLEDIKESRWVMSCFKGQVVYPGLYETSCYDKRGYLTLNWLPGLLRYDGDVYAKVIGDGINSVGNDPFTGVHDMVARPCNLVSDIKLVWRVVKGDTVLQVFLGLSSQKREFSSCQFSPSTILKNLSSALLLEACPHSPAAALESPDEFCAFTGPLHVTAIPREKNGIQVVGVVAVDGSDELRMFSLCGGGSIIPMVLRKDACLSCCLDACRKTNYPVVIL
jgi:hypothetical protein